ncbi:MAG: hypothetical protein KGL39_03780 [Patescibacteria group bacterium]|nr:hypothetical protein [Patescibacteria group bacterium]
MGLLSQRQKQKKAERLLQTAGYDLRPTQDTSESQIVYPIGGPDFFERLRVVCNDPASEWAYDAANDSVRCTKGVIDGFEIKRIWIEDGTADARVKFAALQKQGAPDAVIRPLADEIQERSDQHLRRLDDMRALKEDMRRERERCARDLQMAAMAPYNSHAAAQTQANLAFAQMVGQGVAAGNAISGGIAAGGLGPLIQTLKSPGQYVVPAQYLAPERLPWPSLPAPGNPVDYGPWWAVEASDFVKMRSDIGELEEAREKIAWYEARYPAPRPMPDDFDPYGTTEGDGDLTLLGDSAIGAIEICGREEDRDAMRERLWARLEKIRVAKILADETGLELTEPEQG